MTTTAEINALDLPRLMFDCTGNNSGKYCLSRPFVRQGHIYCTNGQILARMEYPCVDDTPGDWPPIGQYLDRIEPTGATWREAGWLLDRAERVGDTAKLVVPVGSQHLNPYYASLLMWHDALIDDRPGIDGAISWMTETYDGNMTRIRGVVMPCNPV